MNVLGLDIGLRRTGASFGNTESLVPVALDTLLHISQDDLCAQIRNLITAKSIDTVVCGLPKLLSGEEGEQCAHVRDVVDALHDSGAEIVLLDERYTTPRQPGVDPDASAAVQLLLTYFDRTQ